MFPLCNKKWTQITTFVQLIANNTEKYFQWRIDKDFVLGEAPCVEVHIDFGLLWKQDRISRCCPHFNEKGYRINNIYQEGLP